MTMTMYSSLQSLVGRGPKEYCYDDLKQALQANTAEISESYFTNCVVVKYGSRMTVVRKDIVDLILAGDTEKLDAAIENAKKVHWIYRQEK